MSNGQTALASEAIKTWGPLGAFVLLAVVGGYGVKQHLTETAAFEHQRFEARHARETKQTAIIESTCGTLQTEALAALRRNGKLMERMDERGSTWLPAMQKLEKLVQRLDIVAGDGGTVKRAPAASTP